jgi:hypothetical protein
VAFETAFIAGYAVLLLLAGEGLRRLGRVSTDAWSSRLFAAYRAQAPEPVDPAGPADWPHSEVPQLHAVLAGVASSAATLLCVAELVRHHDRLAVAVLAPVAALAAVVTGRTAVALRARARAPQAS